MDELSCWLALARAPASNRVKLEILKRSPCVNSLFGRGRVTPEGVTLPPALERFLRSPDRDALDRDRAWLDAAHARVIPFGHALYPPLLAAAQDAPVVLYLRGLAQALSAPQVAVVGSRNPSPPGREHATRFAQSLSALGLTVTSGLALGIDAQAHRAALDAGGLTVAVAGNGLDRVYPAANGRLSEAIAEQGALVSEFPPGTPPRAAHFPQRNRLISGLSLGVLVVEAALKSGSLITARLAGEQGREVFAVPGSIDNSLSRGCHRLIRDGAKLVESVDDIVIELGPLLASARALDSGESDRQVRPCANSAGHSETANVLLRALGHEPTGVDTLVERTGLTAEKVSSILLALEIEGHVSSAPGGLYSRVTVTHRVEPVSGSEFRPGKV